MDLISNDLYEIIIQYLDLKYLTLFRSCSSSLFKFINFKKIANERLHIGTNEHLCTILQDLCILCYNDRISTSKYTKLSPQPVCYNCFLEKEGVIPRKKILKIYSFLQPKNLDEEIIGKFIKDKTYYFKKDVEELAKKYWVQHIQRIKSSK